MGNVGRSALRTSAQLRQPKRAVGSPASPPPSTGRFSFGYCHVAINSVCSLLFLAQVQPIQRSPSRRFFFDFGPVFWKIRICFPASGYSPAILRAQRMPRQRQKHILPQSRSQVHAIIVNDRCVLALQQKEPAPRREQNGFLKRLQAPGAFASKGLLDGSRQQNASRFPELRRKPILHGRRRSDQLVPSIHIQLVYTQPPSVFFRAGLQTFEIYLKWHGTSKSLMRVSIISIPHS